MSERVPIEEPVELAIGGRVYGGWKNVDVRLDLDAGAAAFQLGVTDRWAGQPDRWEIEAGSAAEVRIGGDVVVTGFIDRLDSQLAGDVHAINVAGRSRTADLMDCSAVAIPGSWSGRALEEIAAELAKPFGVAVTARTSTAPPFRRFAIEQGETVWEAIQRLCAHRGLLAIATATGDVEIITAKAEGAAAALVQGVHLLAIDGFHDVTERFSRYILKGQAAGDDNLNGAAAAGPKAEAADPAVKRHRPLMVIAEEQADLATLQRRADWEAVVRAAKAQEARATVTGWRRADGKLWAPQQAVKLTAPAAWMDAELMVFGAAFILDERGRRAELRIGRAEAFSRLPVPEEAEASKIKEKAA